MLRIVWIAAGCTATFLGMLGAILPLLPTTPFVLLAAFCFMRGSERLHRWLLAHRLFGALIRDWQEEGAISARAKTLAVASMIATLAVSAAFGLALWVLATQAVVLAFAALFVLTRPTA